MNRIISAYLSKNRDNRGSLHRASGWHGFWSFTSTYRYRDNFYIIDMENKEFYNRLLGITRPWYVKDVVLDENDERVDIYVEHEDDILLPCPVCDEYSPVYDHMPMRSWRHLDTCHLKTYIHARLPRIDCHKHGVKQIISEWSESGSDMTCRFDRYLIDLEKECSFSAVSRLTGLSWDKCFGVMNRAVRRGLSRKPHKLPKRIGVDEKSLSRGHHYETIVSDIDTGNVEYVGNDRREKSLSDYFDKFEKKERSAVKAVTMDMWDPYIAATRKAIPNWEEKIVFDKFHVMRQVIEAVDKVRKAEHRELMERDIDILKGTKYLWLWSKENMPPHRRWEFFELRIRDLKVSRAWSIKENIRHLWGYSSKTWALKFFKDWHFWATHSRLKPIIKAAKFIKSHLRNILTYLKHRITNALGESLNSKIEKIKRMACGFRNSEHYRMAIYFHCGGLDLYPKKA